MLYLHCQNSAWITLDKLRHNISLLDSSQQTRTGYWALHTRSGMLERHVVNKALYLPSDCDPAPHKNGRTFAITQMDLEGIMLSEVSQTEKDKYHMISHICGI